MVGRWLPNLPRHLRGEEAVSQLSCQVIVILTVGIVVIVAVAVVISISVISCWCCYRRDIVHFGIDEYDDPLLTYYKVTSSTPIWTMLRYAKGRTGHTSPSLSRPVRRGRLYGNLFNLIWFNLTGFNFKFSLIKCCSIVSRPVREGRLRGDLWYEMQPDLWCNPVSRQQGWLYSLGGGKRDKLRENSRRYASLKKASIQGEKVVLAKCQKALIGGTLLLPTSAIGRPRSFSLPSLFQFWIFQLMQDPSMFWDIFLRLNKLVAACSNIRVNKEMRSIEVTTFSSRTTSPTITTTFSTQTILAENWRFSSWQFNWKGVRLC